MQAVLDLPQTNIIKKDETVSLSMIYKVAKLAVEERRQIILSEVAWETYDEFVQETMDEIRSPHFYFEKGKLLVMPTPEHEDLNRAVASFIEFCCFEWKISWGNLGSSTYQREDIERGFEPDSCFYFEANAVKIRGVKRFDMTVHPAPDLIIEVDITSSSEMRESIFAAFGVAEVWRFDGEKVEFLKLVGDRYELTETSFNLPLVSSEKLTEFVAASETLSRLEWLETIRDWARNALVIEK